jgi:hypothetical protein
VGETAVAQWGYTEGSGVPGMGFDGTGGNQPRGTVVAYNVMREVGLWTKQNSFYFQSEVIATLIEGNIMFNGPRAGVNFDDGFGGGSVLTRNVIANACRESSDHGPFNSAWSSSGSAPPASLHSAPFRSLSPHTQTHTHISRAHKHFPRCAGWNRQVYWWDGPDGQPTHWKANDTISYKCVGSLRGWKESYHQCAR